jgi:hypothetical protein
VFTQTLQSQQEVQALSAKMLFWLQRAVLPCWETPVRISMDTARDRGEDYGAKAVAHRDARRVIRMRKLSVLCAALFCLSLTASAQDSTAALDASNSAGEPAAPASLIPADRDPWQVGAGFEYLQFNVLGLKFHDFGYQADVARYLNNWFAVEGTAIAGFGNAGGSPSIDAKSFFIGGGPHITLHNSVHLEPWVHVLVGWEHFRLTEGATFGSNSHAGFMGGGGLDYHIGGGRLTWRVQGDFIGTNVGPAFSKNYSFGTGLILNF